MDNELLDDELLEKEFDFSKSKPNPYAALLTQEVTMRLNKNVIKYFEDYAKERNMTLERVLNMYLYECMINKRVPNFVWEDEISS